MRVVLCLIQFYLLKKSCAGNDYTDISNFVTSDISGTSAHFEINLTTSYDTLKIKVRKDRELLPLQILHFLAKDDVEATLNGDLDSLCNSV